MPPTVAVLVAEETPRAVAVVGKYNRASCIDDVAIDEETTSRSR